MRVQGPRGVSSLHNSLTSASADNTNRDHKNPMQLTKFSRVKHPPQPHAGHGMPNGGRSHDAHAGHSVAMFRDKFWLSFVLTIPVALWSPDVQHWLGYQAPSFPGTKFIPAILGTVVFVYGGLVFIRGARRELSDRSPA